MNPEPNVILLYGNDEYAMARQVKKYAAIFTDPGSAEMNSAHLDGRTASDDELNNAVNAAPFLAPRRLVRLDNPSLKYNSEGSRRKFYEFLANTPASARLIITEAIEPRDVEKHWLVKWAARNNKLVKSEGFMLPRQNEMTGWLVRETKNQGGQIDSLAANRLAELVGVDTRQAAQEIAKLLAYVDWARPITLQDVESVSIFTAQQSVFDFVDALAAGDGKQAQLLLKRLLATDDWFSLWGMVVRQFRLLIQAREILDGRGNQEDVRRALAVHPYVAGKITTQAGRFSMEALEGLYHKLLDIDVGVKTGRLTLDLALELLVVELAG